jgi:hypothetical protein
MKGAVLFAFGLLVALETSVSTTACKSSCTLSASDYDRTCTKDSDCIGISEGDLCSETCTNCINAVINVRDAKRYQDDFSSRVPAEKICPCPSVTVACNAGTCGFAMFPETSMDAEPLDAG